MIAAELEVTSFAESQSAQMGTKGAVSTIYRRATSGSERIKQIQRLWLAA